MKNEEFQEFANKCYAKYGDDIDAANHEIEQRLEHECNRITIMFPHLRDLHPAAELVDRSTCPHGLDGDCDGCEHFVTYKSNARGEIFSFMAFTAYCDKEGDTNGSTNKGTTEDTDVSGIYESNTAEDQ